MKAIVLDIEGTTTDINFVHNVLFPYAQNAIPHFLEDNKMDKSVKIIIDKIKKNYHVEKSNEILDLLLHWIKTDQKIKELKELQGLIWQDGYKRGEYVAHLYPDVVPHLKKWKEKGIKLYIYSSGSVLAQKLLFSHTEYGDITPLIDGYFDTNIGSKKEEISYSNIINDLELDANNVTFLSDIEAELSCAHAVGINVFHINRDGLYRESKFNLVGSFNDLGEI